MKQILIWAASIFACSCRAPQPVQQLSSAPETGSLEGVATGKTRFIDLPHALNPRNPHWPGPGYKPFSKYHIENVANLDRISAAGAFVIAAPIKNESRTGGPARIFVLAGSDAS